MITHPRLLALTLILIVMAILYGERLRFFSRVYERLPVPFWCYFLPMLLSTFHVLPESSPVYGFFSTYGLSACLILLLLGVNVPALLRVGPTAAGALAAGALGMMLGATGSYAVFAHWLPEEMWKGVGALSASWIGGTANMVAVKEGLNTPESVFAPMVIVDTVMSYAWMGLLIALAPRQAQWDKWVGSAPLPEEAPVSALQKDSGVAATVHFFWIIPSALLLGTLCIKVAAYLPTAGASLTKTTWAFILASIAGVALSFSPASRLERFGASRWGYFCLYLLLASVGAKARLNAILNAPLILVMAVLWLAIHATVLLTYGAWRKLPFFFIATASQACIGGVASTPIVAGVYRPRLAPLGLLLAICANVVGTYLGLIVAEICRFIAR